jgi:hypothetical protein
MQNKDLTLDKWLVHKQTGAVAKCRDLLNQPLSREIYFSPSYSPLIHVKDSRLGSCFENWMIPTALPHGQSVTLDHYQNQLYDLIQSAVKDVYRKHQMVYLALSGGIDSMVLLSFVLNLRLSQRTVLVVLENHTQSNKDCLHIDMQRKQQLFALCSQLDMPMHYEIFSLADLANAANHGLAEIKCYITHALLSRYRDQAWMFGFHGNQLLLHKEVFLDEILTAAPDKTLDVMNAIAQPEFYTQSLKHYDVQKIKHPLKYHHLLLKPWSALNGVNNNTLYAPIGATDRAFDLCRQIDFGTVDPNVITNAAVARWIIDQNQQYWLQNYISTESTKDIDNLEHVNVPLNLLNSDVLTVPDKLVHHPEGHEWLLQEASRAKQCGHIALNTLVSLKNLQWLASLKDTVN